MNIKPDFPLRHYKFSNSQFYNLAILACYKIDNFQGSWLSFFRNDNGLGSNFIKVIIGLVLNFIKSPRGLFSIL